MPLHIYFLWACSLFSTTLFGVPFPLPTPQGRRAQQLKTRPECWIRGLHEASTQGIEATSANLFRKECLGMQRSPKAMLLRPTNVDLPECDCHLPPMESDGRRSRPVFMRLDSFIILVNSWRTRAASPKHSSKEPLPSSKCTISPFSMFQTKKLKLHYWTVRKFPIY